MRRLTLEEAEKSGLLAKLCKTAEEMGFSPRSQNSLHDAGIYILAQYVVLRVGQTSIRNFGRKSKKEVREELKDLGLFQGMMFARDLTAHINAFLAEFQVSRDWKGLPPLGTWLFVPGRSSYPIGASTPMFDVSPPEEAVLLSPRVKPSTRLEQARGKIVREIDNFKRRRRLFEDLRESLVEHRHVGKRRAISQVVQRFLRRLGHQPTVEDVDRYIAALDAWHHLATEIMDETGGSEFDRVLAVVLGLETFFGSH